MTDKLLISSPELAAILAHFNIITTYQGVKGDPGWAGFYSREASFYMDVFSASYSKGQRYEFHCPGDAEAFAAGARDGEVIL